MKENSQNIKRAHLHEFKGLRISDYLIHLQSLNRDVTSRKYFSCVAVSESDRVTRDQ